MKAKKVNLKRKPSKPREQIVFQKSKYAVVEFVDDRIKLFEGIPELWFVNEERNAFYWPPKTGRSFKLRAINQETPDWDWDIYECIVVSEGHGKIFLFEAIEFSHKIMFTDTYSIASGIVREKCAQRYNTSSADDYLEAVKYRREHPGLIHKGEKCFENLFQNAKSAEMKRDSVSTLKNQEQRQKAIDDCENVKSLDSPPDRYEARNNNDGFNPKIDVHQNDKPRSQNGILSNIRTAETTEQIDSKTEKNHSHSQPNKTKLQIDKEKNLNSKTVESRFSVNASSTSNIIRTL